MKLTNKEKIVNAADKVTSSLKALWNRRPKMPKKIKPIKKNTWKRKLKALDLRLDRRQRVGLVPPAADETNRTCTNCGQELLKICSKCNGVNFPTATKCRKCGTSFGEVTKKNSASKNKNDDILSFKPDFCSFRQGIENLNQAISDKNKKIISLTGDKGCGKTSVL